MSNSPLGQTKIGNCDKTLNTDGVYRETDNLSVYSSKQLFQNHIILKTLPDTVSKVGHCEQFTRRQTFHGHVCESLTVCYVDMLQIGTIHTQGSHTHIRYPLVPCKSYTSIKHHNLYSLGEKLLDCITYQMSALQRKKIESPLYKSMKNRSSMRQCYKVYAAHCCTLWELVCQDNQSSEWN